MVQIRRSLVSTFTAALLLSSACADANGPSGPLQIQTSLSRGSIVPGDTMTIHVAVTSATQVVTPGPGPGGCNFPFYIVKNTSGAIVDQGGVICAASSNAGGYPVASATYVWSAEPYVCDSMLCRQSPLPAGFYSITGEYQTESGPIYSDAKFIQIMGRP
jgi:hypothetical protein